MDDGVDGFAILGLVVNLLFPTHISSLTSLTSLHNSSPAKLGKMHHFDWSTSVFTTCEHDSPPCAYVCNLNWSNQPSTSTGMETGAQGVFNLARFNLVSMRPPPRHSRRRSASTKLIGFTPITGGLPRVIASCIFAGSQRPLCCSSSRFLQKLQGSVNALRNVKLWRQRTNA